MTTGEEALRTGRTVREDDEDDVLLHERSSSKLTVPGWLLLPARPQGREQRVNLEAARLRGGLNVGRS